MIYVRGLEVHLHPFLTMTVDRCECSASQPGHITPRVEHVSLHFCLPSQIILKSFEVLSWTAWALKMAAGSSPERVTVDQSILCHTLEELKLHYF